MRLRFVFSELAIGLRKNVLMMISVVIVTAFSMLALGIALLVQRQVSHMKHYWYNQLQVSVYLCADHSENPNCPTAATEAQIADVQSALNALRPTVKSIDFVDQARAYEYFKETFKDAPDLVKNTSPDALPESFAVKLADPSKFSVVSSALDGKPGVDSVQDQHVFLKKLFSILNALRLVAIVISVTVIIAAVILIGVAVQVSAASRRRETGIMRLVGASNLYIQLPFLLEGVVGGFVGAAVGFGGLALVKWVLVDHSLRTVFGAFGALVEWHDVMYTLPFIVGSAVVISGLASFVTLRIYLRD
jgi:cell division transport system permease protein